MKAFEHIINIEKSTLSENEKLDFIEENFSLATQEEGVDLDSLYLTVLNINKRNYNQYINEETQDLRLLKFTDLLTTTQKGNERYCKKTISYNSLWALSHNVLTEVLLDTGTYINDVVWHDSELVKSIDLNNPHCIQFFKYFHDRAIDTAEKFFLEKIKNEGIEETMTKKLLAALKELTNVRYKRMEVLESVANDTAEVFAQKLNNNFKYILNSHVSLEIFRLIMRFKDREKMQLFSQKRTIKNFNNQRYIGGFTNELMNSAENLVFIKENASEKQFKIMIRDLYKIFINDLLINDKEILKSLPKNFFYNMEEYFLAHNSTDKKYSVFIAPIIAEKYIEGEIDNLHLHIKHTPALDRAKELALATLLRDKRVKEQNVQRYVSEHPNFANYDIASTFLESHSAGLDFKNILLKHDINTQFIAYMHPVESTEIEKAIRESRENIHYKNLNHMLLHDKIKIEDGLSFIKSILTLHHQKQQLSFNKNYENEELMDFVAEIYVRDEKLKFDDKTIDSLLYLSDRIKEKIKIKIENEILKKNINGGEKIVTQFKL